MNAEKEGKIIISPWKKKEFEKAEAAVRRRTVTLGLAYSVQYVWDVDNSVNNVRRTLRNGVIHFEVPVCLQDAHKLGFEQLLVLAQAGELLDLSTTLNNTDTPVVPNISSKVVSKSSLTKVPGSTNLKPCIRESSIPPRLPQRPTGSLPSQSPRKAGS
jgi:hypothetical protein